MFGAPAFGMGLSQPTQSQGEAKKRVDEKQSCLPVTIRAIEHAIAAAEGGEVQFQGEVPGMLILVANVEEVNKQSTCMELVLNDSTGRIKARYFVTDDSSTKTMDEINVGMYVNLYGNVRTAPTNHFAILGIRPVSSADEVSYHMIEVAHAYLRNKQGTDPAASLATKPAVAVAPGATGGYADSQPKVVQASAAALDGDQLKEAVTAFLQKESSEKGEEGVNVAEIMKQFPQTAEDKVRACLLQLVEDGDAFTTKDDDHFSIL